MAPSVVRVTCSSHLQIVALLNNTGTLPLSWCQHRALLMLSAPWVLISACVLVWPSSCRHCCSSTSGLFHSSFQHAALPCTAYSVVMECLNYWIVKTVWTLWTLDRLKVLKCIGILEMWAPLKSLTLQIVTYFNTLTSLKYCKLWHLEIFEIFGVEIFEPVVMVGPVAKVGPVAEVGPVTRVVLLGTHWPWGSTVRPTPGPTPG